MIPDQDIVIAKGKSPGLDPSAFPPDEPINQRKIASTSALLIDATRPWPYPPLSLPRKEFMENSKTIWEELKLPPLKPRLPWYGYSQGAWTKEDEDEAELALKGEHFITGEKAKSRRVKP